jgi:hypothetical protein
LPDSGVVRLPVSGTQLVARRRLAPKASWVNAERRRMMCENRNLLILKGGTGAMVGETASVADGTKRSVSEGAKKRGAHSSSCFQADVSKLAQGFRASRRRFSCNNLLGYPS